MKLHICRPEFLARCANNNPRNSLFTRTHIHTCRVHTHTHTHIGCVWEPCSNHSNKSGEKLFGYHRQWEPFQIAHAVCLLAHKEHWRPTLFVKRKKKESTTKIKIGLFASELKPNGRTDGPPSADALKCFGDKFSSRTISCRCDVRIFVFIDSLRLEY